MKDHRNSDERQWQEHFYADNQQVEQRRAAERAVIEAAKVMVGAVYPPKVENYREYMAALADLLTAVATLRELEGEV